MKTPLASLLALLAAGLQTQTAAAQCLPTTGAASAMAEAAAGSGHGLWMAALGLMAGIAWRRQGH